MLKCSVGATCGRARQAARTGQRRRRRSPPGRRRRRSWRTGRRRTLPPQTGRRRRKRKRRRPSDAAALGARHCEWSAFCVSGSGRWASVVSVCRGMSCLPLVVEKDYHVVMFVSQCIICMQHRCYNTGRATSILKHTCLWTRFYGPAPERHTIPLHAYFSISKCLAGPHGLIRLGFVLDVLGLEEQLHGRHQRRQHGQICDEAHTRHRLWW